MDVDLFQAQDQLARFIVLGLVEHAQFDLIFRRLLIVAVEAMAGGHDPFGCYQRAGAELVGITEDWLLEQGDLPRPTVRDRVFATDDLRGVGFDRWDAAFGCVTDFRDWVGQAGTEQSESDDELHLSKFLSFFRDSSFSFFFEDLRVDNGFIAE
jgi:hypothetical protein